MMPEHGSLPPDTFYIPVWGDVFENNRTRELKRMTWVAMPNKHDGDGYTELLNHPDGPAHFGVWCAIVQVASKCDPRGALVRDTGKPHTAESISRMTRFPMKVVESAMHRLLQISWLNRVMT
ncbi:MAG: hypothetical protein U1E51_02810, partial [Candidatus Binatia bacterium]|nr:hypothetical protein [Candidatus Binatia bacterium]